MCDLDWSTVPQIESMGIDQSVTVSLPLDTRLAASARDEGNRHATAVYTLGSKLFHLAPVYS